jgi:hypothetical protein
MMFPVVTAAVVEARRSVRKRSWRVGGTFLCSTFFSALYALAMTKAGPIGVNQAVFAAGSF